MFRAQSAENDDNAGQVKSLQMQGVALAKAKVSLEARLEHASQAVEVEREEMRQTIKDARETREAETAGRAHAEQQLGWYQRELRSRDDELLARDKRVRSLEAEVRALRDRVVATEFGPTFPLASQGLAGGSPPNAPVWQGAVRGVASPVLSSVASHGSPADLDVSTRDLDQGGGGGLVGPPIHPMVVPLVAATFPASEQLDALGGKPSYTGDLKDGWPHGRGVTTWADGRRYDGEWLKGVFAGLGTCIWSNSDRYEGEWRDGFAHGLGCYTFANGDIFEGLFFQDKFHGAGALHTVSGWRYRGGWEAGKMHGPAMVLPHPTTPHSDFL